MANDKKLVATVSSTLERLIENFGGEYVIRQAAEECMELGQAILKEIRKANCEAVRNDDNNVLEEIADVLICIGQVIEASGYPPMWIEDAIKDKVQRTKERLEKTFY